MQNPNPDNSRLADLIDQPWQLFAALYKILEPNYSTISNTIYTDRSARERFENLAQHFSETIKTIYSLGATPDQIENLKRTIREEHDYNLLCLSLFKAVGEYLAVYKMGTLKQLNAIKIDDLIITPTPPNPIYDVLQHSGRGTRENVGTGLHDLGIFKNISVIKQSNLKINLTKNDKIDLTNIYLRRRVKNSFKIAVTPFMKDIEYNFDSLHDSWPANEPTPYWFKSIGNLEKTKEFLVEKVLNPSLEKEVDILVLPELTIDEEILSFLRNWLMAENRERVSYGKNGLLMIVAGSFHHKTEDGKSFNTSTILNHAGNILWIQKKLKRYALDKNDLSKNPEIRELLKVSEFGAYENILETDEICCLDTPLGRISVCICIDFFHPTHLEVFKQTGINLFLIPAMTLQNIKFLRTSWDLTDTNQASSFFANSGYAAKKVEGKIQEAGASFYNLPKSSKQTTYALDRQSTLLVFDFSELSNS